MIPDRDTASTFAVLLALFFGLLLLRFFFH